MKFTVTENINDSRIIPFLLHNQNATIYHHPAWLKALTKTFHHKAFYILLESANNEIEGLFPFIMVNSFVTGKRIISLPFSTYCDPLFNKKILPEAIDIIQASYPKFIKFDIRTLCNYTQTLEKFSTSAEYVTHILPLEETYEKTYASFSYKNIKSRIRKAEKYGLDIRWADRLDDLKIFYGLEVSLRKRLSLPPLPFAFYKNVWYELSQAKLISLPLVIKDDRVIAAGFILNFKDTYYLEYTASNQKFLKFAPNHKLISEVIKKANLESACKVDFGRSSTENESLITFKEQWNAKRFPIYRYFTPKRQTTHKMQSYPKKYLMMLNSILPQKILEFEGKMIYPHLG